MGMYNDNVDSIDNSEVTKYGMLVNIYNKKLSSIGLIQW